MNMIRFRGGIICVFLLFLGCFFYPSSTASMDNDGNTQTFLFQTESTDTIGIWKLEIAADSTLVGFDRVYEIPRYYPLSILPDLELGIMSSCNCDSCDNLPKTAEKRISQISISPDQKHQSWIESAYICDQSIKCYSGFDVMLNQVDLHNLVAMEEFSYHYDAITTRTIRSLDWSANSQYLAMVSKLDPQDIWQLNIFDVEKEKSTHTYSIDEFYAWAPTGSMLAYNQYSYIANKRVSSIVVVDLESGTQRMIPSGFNTIRTMIWSPDGTKIAVVGDEDGKYYIVHLYDTLSGKVSNIEGLEGVLAISWSPNSEHILSISKLNTLLQVVDVKSTRVDTIPNPMETFYDGLPKWQSDSLVAGVTTYLDESLKTTSGFIFIDITNSSIMRQYESEAVTDSWYFLDQKIKVIVQTDPNPGKCIPGNPSGIGIYDLTNNRLEMVDLSYGINKRLADCSLEITNLVR